MTPGEDNVRLVDFCSWEARLKRLVIGIVSSIALATSVMAVAPAASAFDLYDQNMSVCKRVTGWGPDGSRALVKIWDRGSFPNRYTLRLNLSRSKGQLVNCRSGYFQPGGQKRLRASWTVRGEKITDCVFGTSLGCTVSADHTTATRSFGTGWKSNGDGQTLNEFYGGDIYANPNNGGYIRNYIHTASADFRKDGVSVLVQQSNMVYR